MLSKATKIQRDSPTNIKAVERGQTPASVASPSRKFHQLPLTSAQARSENPEQGAFTYPACICFTANNVKGIGESMLCPHRTEIERKCQGAHESLNLEKIGEKGLNILQASSSDLGVKGKHHHMTQQNSPQQENCSSTRSRSYRLEGEKRGGIDEGPENAGAADPSNSTLKVNSGDSDLTAERMAEGSSSTTSSSDNSNGCTLKLNPPPSSTTTDYSKAAKNQLSFNVKEKFQGISSDSGLHKLNVDDGQTVYRLEGFSSSSSKPVSGKDENWLALGLGCSYASRQALNLSNRGDLDMTKNFEGSAISWISDRDEDYHRREKQEEEIHLSNTGQTSKLTTLLPPSSSIQAEQFSLHNITNSISRPLPQASKVSLRTNTNVSGLNLLQPCSIEHQQRSKNITVFPLVEQGFKFQQQQTAETSSRSNETSRWQGFYDRIKEANMAGSTHPGFSEPSMAASYQGSQRFSQGWKSLINGSASAYQNSETSGPASGGIPEAGVLQQAILETMQCRTEWNTRDNFSSWCNPETSVGSLFRPAAAEIATRNVFQSDRSLPFTQQLYERHAFQSETNLRAVPFVELQRFPGVAWTENVKVFRPSRAAQTGVWFALQALNDQNGDRKLPQIPNNYIRIKDATMTILVVKKYLANKLGVNSESEIEIMCKGRQLLPSLTLQQVRDVIWSSAFTDGEISRSVVASTNHSSSNHLMVLQYQRKLV